MDDTRFDQISEKYLHALLEALDDIDDLEAELSQGVMTISFAGGPPFIVNSHRAARQIWMAADRSAWHFDPDEAGGRWVSSKPPHEELRAALSAELSRRLGRAVALGAADHSG